MGALSFSSPLLLSALIALPAIWFLLRATPPAPKEVRFPAFDILRRLAKTEETPDKTPWQILLLRIAIAAFAVLALAGPTLNALPPPTSAGPLIVVVDDSWAAAPGWRLRREAILSAAEQAARAGRETYLATTVFEGDAPLEPMTGAALADRARSLSPQPYLPDYVATLSRIEALRNVKDAEILWLSDGLLHAGAQELHNALENLGKTTVDVEQGRAIVALGPPARADGALRYTVERIGAAPFKGAVVATARDGRELARAIVDIPAGAASGEARLDLPLALQNELAQARIDGTPSAGAVQLVDARERRALVGFAATGEANVDPLLSGPHFVRKALEPYALFETGALETLVASDASVIVLDDVGVIRPNDVDALTKWIEEGGVVIRFAGPTLAEAAADRVLPLLPAPLRGGGRAFGGALTWETPQTLGDFAADGPFADLVPPADVFVRRQVLAEPGGETSLRTWASLKDGTPLVTGVAMGKGALALFHATATPEWSDLPLSTTFIEMLRKLVFLSALGPTGPGDEAARAAPYRVLDGFGALRQPPRDAAAVTLADLAAGPAPGRPPGLYGAPEAPIAVNAVGADAEFRAFDVAGADIGGYAAEPPVKFAPPLFALALLLLAIDGLVALRLSGRLSFAALALVASVALPAPSRAEPLDRPLDPTAVESALHFRLAYVKTGDPATDRASAAGLQGLSRELTRRTSAEPDAPIGVDPETDDLSVYPFLYWPMTAGAAAPSDEALANIENFMRFGGLLVFDTRDDERAIDGADTPEAVALKTILGNLDLPPLTVPGKEHVLKRSFYLLPDLPGRMSTRPIFVQAGAGPNDSVSSVIIGGRDWAGAWASDELGRPIYPMASGGDRAREFAYRAGINMVMVALTGNYKSDQVHTPVLLERLGRP
jgi:hypothetical protein